MSRIDELNYKLYFVLCLLSGLGNFVVGFHIYSSSNSSVFADKVSKKQSNIWIRRHYN